MSCREIDEYGVAACLLILKTIILQANWYTYIYKMAKNLVIVESPAKAKTIEGYLGKDFVVKSSYGHVRDLAKKGTAIDVENNFLPNYEVSRTKKQIVSELGKNFQRRPKWCG